MFYGGSIVALVTPLSNNNLDLTALQALIKYHEESGTEALVVCGSTGEGNLLTSAERETIIRLAVEKSNLPIIVGCGGISTAEAISQALQAQSLGAHGLLVVSPYYCKPTQQGIYQHFTAVHEATKLPIILYNNPARTSVEITVSTVCQLFTLPRVVALKDSTNDLLRPLIIRKNIQKKVGLLAGDDGITLPYLSHGGTGAISVIGNIFPALWHKMINSFLSGNHQEALQIIDQLSCTLTAMSLEPNPIPVKAALSIINRCNNELRAPLTIATKTNIEKITESLAKVL